MMAVAIPNKIFRLEAEHTAPNLALGFPSEDVGEGIAQGADDGVTGFQRGSILQTEASLNGLGQRLSDHDFTSPSWVGTTFHLA